MLLKRLPLTSHAAHLSLHYYKALINYIIFFPSTPECHIYCALAWDVWPGYFVQDTPGSGGAGPQLLLPLSPPFSRTHPALPLSQLLPHLPSSVGPVPCPGHDWRSPTETDQRKVRMESSLEGFVVLSPSHSLPTWKVGLTTSQSSWQHIHIGFWKENLEWRLWEMITNQD